MKRVVGIVITVQLLSGLLPIASPELVENFQLGDFCATEDVISDMAAVDINEKQGKGVMPRSTCGVKIWKNTFCQKESKLCSQLCSHQLQTASLVLVC